MMTRRPWLAAGRRPIRAALPLVRKAQVPGLQSTKVALKTKSAMVTFDPAKATPQALTRATPEAGYPSTVQGVR